MIASFKKQSYKKPSGRTVSKRYGGGGGSFRKRQYFWQRRMFKIWLILGVFVLLFILYLFFWSGIFKITNIKIEGNQTITQAQIEDIIIPQLEKRRFGIFSQSNIWF